MTPPLVRLRDRVSTLGAPLCVGVDPHPADLPAGFPRDVRGIERFAIELIEATAEHAVAFKLNVAFYEAYGSAGWAALERARAAVPREIFVILDAKRGDIGPTAERYAEGLMGRLGADAVTLSPFLGEDAVEPFLAYPDSFVYVLSRTSNPGAGVVQEIDAGGAPLYERIAEWVAGRWPGGSRVGLVVGATAPRELARLREVVPELPFLVPGVGPQGGDLDAAVSTCHARNAPGVVSISRAIAGASRERDWARAAARAADSWRARMLEVGATLSA